MNIESVADQLERLLQMERDAFRRVFGGGPHDPFAYKPAPTTKRPPQRSGAVAVDEPDDSDRD